MSPVIRPATVGDIAAIAGIYGEAVRHGTASFETEPPTAEEMGRRMAAIRDSGLPYLVGELRGAVRGYAYAGLYHHRRAYRFTVENSIYVAADCHRGGIGRALLMRLMADCEALGYRQMIAIIGDSQNLASIGLHDAAGFRMVGKLTNVGFKFDRWLDSVIMQRALGQGADDLPAGG